ncbi:hypothetical protein GCM10029964_056210 [Kibdelosporangium lantanae]
MVFMGVDLIPAMPAGEDMSRTRSRLRNAHELFVSSHTVPPFIRPAVAGSWRRCAAVGASFDGNRLPPTRMGTDELAGYRLRHPLAVLLPVFQTLLGESADDGEHVFAVCHADGLLLGVLRRRGARPGAGAAGVPVLTRDQLRREQRPWERSR